MHMNEVDRRLATRLYRVHKVVFLCLKKEKMSIQSLFMDL